MPRATYRGQPLVALMLLLGGWVTVRVMVVDATSPERVEFAAHAQDGPAPKSPASVTARAAPRQPASAEPVLDPEPPIGHAVPYFAPPRYAPAAREPLLPAARLAPKPQDPARNQVEKPAEPVPVHIAAGHQMLWMAALSNLPLPASVLALAAPRSPKSAPALAPAPSRASSYRDPRWSADGWLLLRRGGGTASPAGGLVAPSYGASQVGAVLRYRLAPQSPHRPALYLRGSAALNGSREHEAAFGASARPIAGLPVVVAAEARVNRQPGATRVRPAAFAYTELPPVALPLGMRAEAYGQAGYVGGNFASAFADGQLRVDRRLARIGRGELRAGGGAWGGAQKGASRLDVGPTATVGVPIGGSAGARFGVDWRFRVAGNAAPSSGPALTLSAGF